MFRKVSPLMVVLSARAVFSAVVPATAPSIKWLNCSSHVPEPLQGVNLPAVLPDTLHCGQLDVPMDYSAPLSSVNVVTLSFAM